MKVGSEQIFVDVIVIIIIPNSSLYRLKSLVAASEKKKTACLKHLQRNSRPSPNPTSVLWYGAYANIIILCPSRTISSSIPPSLALSFPPCPPPPLLALSLPPASLPHSLPPSHVSFSPTVFCVQIGPLREKRSTLVNTNLYVHPNEPLASASPLNRSLLEP
jgi:hypothetical protein